MDISRHHLLTAKQVIHARDGDHSSAWENYINLTQSGETSTPKEEGTREVTMKSPRMKKGVEVNDNHRSAMKLYGSPPQHRNIYSRKSSRSRKATPKSQEKNDFDEKPSIPISVETNPPQHTVDEVDETQTVDTLGPSYQQEAKRLARLNRIKDKLRGQYLRFDIPDSLDDSVSRFIVAVTLRYKFETPDESSLHGNFESKFLEKEHQQKCMIYAEPLIQRLHGMGIVFIRQLLPADNMATILSGMGVTEDFLLLSNSLIIVLHQMSGGNFLKRKYLMAKSRQLLETQNQLKGSSSPKRASGHHFSLASFLGECGAAGSDSYDDDDNPGGIWTRKAPCSVENQAKCRQETIRIPAIHLPHTTRKTRNKSWVIPYTAKIISENESNHPALGAYRHGQLLGPG